MDNKDTKVTTPLSREAKGGGVSRLFKDTAIYGLSSIIGRFLNYLLVPLYTHYMPTESGDYGISTNVYAYTALILVILTFGRETTLFRFACFVHGHGQPDVYVRPGGQRAMDDLQRCYRPTQPRER